MPESPYQSPFDFFEIKVDSISFMEVNGQQLKVLHIQYSVNTDTQETPFTLVETLCYLESLFFGYLGILTLCDADYNNGLRCFENDDLGLVSFVDYPCDSTWILSSTEKKEITFHMEIYLYPDPAQDILQVHIFNNEQPRIFEISTSSSCIEKSFQQKIGQLNLIFAATKQAFIFGF
ncbi:MAG: hypothetical protein ACI9XO_001498 [Paraglaciecola sp.]|jgi:hypothetical protein